MALAGCVGGERHETTIHRTWPATAINRLEIHEIDGSVSVEPGMGDEVEMTAHVRSRGVEPKKNEENEGYFRTEVRGDTLQIGRRGRHAHFFFFDTNNISVDYTLRVPPRVTLAVQTVNGHIETRGVDGETQLTTVNGRIDAEHSGTSEFSAHTVNGRVRATFLRDFNGAQLKTVNGGVEAILPPSASFACDVSQVNGDFQTVFPLSIHSHPGSRRVSGDVNGGKYELRITTVNGDIQLENTTVPPVPPAPPSLPAMPTPPAPPAPPAPPVG